MSTTLAGRMPWKIPRRYHLIRKPRQFTTASHIYCALTTNLLCPDYGSDNGVTTSGQDVLDDLAPVPPPYLIRQSSRINYALTIFSMSTTIAGRMSQKIPRRCQSIRKPRQFIRKASRIYYALSTNLLCPRRCQSIRRLRHSLRKARQSGCLTTQWSTKVSCHVTR